MDKDDELAFSPCVWPEAETPPGALLCKKCELNKQRSRVIWGEGNPHAPILVLLDNPGAREDKEGNPFVCGTRQALQSAAFKTGFEMDDLFITYILKCRPVRSYDKEAARGACMLYLEQQLKELRPRLALCMGNVAAKWFFGDINAEVKNLRGILHIVKDIPTVVTYHPLAIRRRPNLMRHFIEDWSLLAQCYKS